MAILSFSDTSIIQAALTIAAMLFLVMGCALVNMTALKRIMSSTFPEDGLPYKHYFYRRNVGIAYIVIALLILLFISRDIALPYHTLMSFWMLTIAFANSIVATTAILSLLYASRLAFRIMVVEASLLVVLMVAFLLSTYFPATHVSCGHIWVILLGVLLLANLFIYIRTRRRYLRTMFGHIGYEALDFTRRHITMFYIPSLLLSLLALALPHFACTLSILLLILSLSAYYVALACYYRHQSFDSAVVEETMAKPFDWESASDTLWRKMIRENY